MTPTSVFFRDLMSFLKIKIKKEKKVLAHWKLLVCFSFPLKNVIYYYLFITGKSKWKWNHHSCYLKGKRRNSLFFRKHFWTEQQIPIPKSPYTLCFLLADFSNWFNFTCQNVRAAEAGQCSQFSPPHMQPSPTWHDQGHSSSCDHLPASSSICSASLLPHSTSVSIS